MTRAVEGGPPARPSGRTPCCSLRRAPRWTSSARTPSAGTPSRGRRASALGEPGRVTPTTGTSGSLRARWRSTGAAAPGARRPGAGGTRAGAISRCPRALEQRGDQLLPAHRRDGVLLLVLGLVMVLSSSSVESLADDESPYAVVPQPGPVRARRRSRLLVDLSRMPVAALQCARVAGARRRRACSSCSSSRRWAWAQGGNKNWIVRRPAVTMQPSEIVKLALACGSARSWRASARCSRDWKHALVPAVPVAGVAVGLVLLGNDLGTAMVLMLLVGGRAVRRRRAAADVRGRRGGRGGRCRRAAHRRARTGWTGSWRCSATRAT